MARSARIFISVCEESADVHAASLVRAARAAGHAWEFYGLTGPRLRELSVETLYDFAAHAAMLSGVLGLIGKARDVLRKIELEWDRARPDLVVLLDSPELHLKVARRARQRGIRVLYYIAPQTWASRAYRNAAIVRDIDRLACILPFEEDYFGAAAAKHAPSAAPSSSTTVGARGFRATYVGHPLFEALRREQPTAQTLTFLSRRANGRRTLALLPGSRQHVIEAMLPRQLDVLRRLRAAGHDVYAAISCVSTERRDQIRELLSAAAPTLAARNGADGAHGADAVPDAAPPPGVESPGHDIGIDIVIDDNASLLTAADLTLVASGTATLQVAYYRQPMIVMYDAGRLMRWLFRAVGRRLITTPHLALVNILAQARVVPEFMPFVPDTAPLAAVAGQLLSDQTWRELMVRQLDELVRPLEDSRASERVCELIAEMLAPAT